ncbi:MAG: transposase [Bacteroidota bacterium]
MKKHQKKRSPEEKERIIKDVKRLGVVAGCRKHGIYPGMYYEWSERYESHGLSGLGDRRSQNQERALKKLEKENRLMKEIVAEKELIIKMQQELIKKKYKAEKQKGK